MPVVRFSAALCGTVTMLSPPLNSSPFPNRPVVHVAPATAPFNWRPEESAAIEPAPSLKPRARTRDPLTGVPMSAAICAALRARL